MKSVDAFEGLTIKDLLSKDGLVIEVGEDDESPEKENDVFDPSSIDLLEAEMIRSLKTGGCDMNDEVGIGAAEAMMPWSSSFEEIKSKAEKLTNDGKIMKLIRKEGVGEVLPPNCLATVHYTAYIEHQDEPFDSTFRRGEPDTLRLNQKDLIPGLEFGLLSMRKHEVAWFVVHYDYAYMEIGCLPLVPPKSNILFIVNVLDFIHGGSAETLESLSAEERKKFHNVKIRAEVLIKKAVESFKRNKTRQAIREYSRATAMLEDVELESDEEKTEVKALLSRAYGNLAVCYNKEDRPRQAYKACLNVPNPTAKTHFHHGRALLKMGEYKKALEKLHLSLKEEPSNEFTIKEIQLANTLQRKFIEAEKRLWQNCLKIRHDGEAVDKYVPIAKEFCEGFAKNEAILHQPLPEGLTHMEDKCMRLEAAKLGLKVVQLFRYGKEKPFLTKVR